MNDGAAALILASEKAIKEHHLTPIAKVLGAESYGVAPRIMGIGPVSATQRLLQRLAMTIDDFDVIELNEAFASQAVATVRGLNIKDTSCVNPNGGAIALGHPLGMSGARITGTAALELSLSKARFALATMCVGVGQGVTIALENVL